MLEIKSAAHIENGTFYETLLRTVYDVMEEDENLAQTEMVQRKGPISC